MIIRTCYFILMLLIPFNGQSCRHTHIIYNMYKNTICVGKKRRKKKEEERTELQGGMYCGSVYNININEISCSHEEENKKA